MAMKKCLPLLLIFLFLFNSLFATEYNIDINGFTFTPDNLTVNVGDVVIIEAADFHPLQQVSQSTWNANGNTPLSGGFSSTSPYTLTITAGMAGSTIYYVCAAHVSGGMKGRINVNVTSSVSDNRLLDYNFTVFPNPVRGVSQLNISTKKTTPVTINLFDANGRMIHQLYYLQIQPGEITLPFNAVALSKGTYFLLMRTSEGTLKKQILVY
jgi:plastocyanin